MRTLIFNLSRIPNDSMFLIMLHTCKNYRNGKYETVLYLPFSQQKLRVYYIYTFYSIQINIRENITVRTKLKTHIFNVVYNLLKHLL